MSDPAGWYPQPDGQQMHWNGHKYTATWSAGVVAVANPVGGEPGAASAQAAWGAAMPTAPLAGKGFFASLFDFGFTSFITLQLLSVIYGIVVVLVVLASVFAIGAGIYRGGASLFAIVVVPIAALIYLVLARVSMEMIALFFRIGQNTNLMAALASGAGSHARTVDLSRA